MIINANHASTRFFRRVRTFESGEIYNLAWEDGNFATHWKTREIDGYIADYQVKDVDDDGEEDLVVGVVDFGSITDRKGTSTILFFKLSELGDSGMSNGKIVMTKACRGGPLRPPYGEPTGVPYVSLLVK